MYYEYKKMKCIGYYRLCHVGQTFATLCVESKKLLTYSATCMCLCVVISSDLDRSFLFLLTRIGEER